ncbi:unnamed protein product [Adineta ricciae]|uniref:Uncharacterized protein n=1 Tax=Adineta ricciae TaxID=249248 RepID=A0A815K9G9_ADIRI|nr:unnamed protein product [Adineta ricciae]CAF1386877.1 unnamed protein product [Adineta ricciae]
MAHLLGSKACIESLHVDIDDLQNVVYDIICKTGSIKCHSWKFPDKLATDVNIKELLERYRHGKNEVDNQVSHIILFEIIIDRLLLVIHGSWHFLHEVQTKILPNTLDPSSTIDQQTCLSIGLVIKKYWTKLVQLFTILQQHESRHKRSKPIPVTSISNTLTTDKYCQTVDTSFSPCSSCFQLQQSLRNHGDNIINRCHLYNLPSTLAHHRCSTANIPEWLSATDIIQWFEFQSKDFDCLSKYVETLNTTLNKTKTDLDASEKLYKQQNETNRRLQHTINELKQSKKILQESYDNRINEMKKLHEQDKLNCDEQIKVLITEKFNVEQQLKTLNEECLLKGEQLETLESSKNELIYLNDYRIKSDEIIKTFEQDRIRLQTELDVVKRDLDERNRDLQKERMRIENMIRQEENHQSKQKLLTKSYEELSQECETLKKQVIDLENQRDELQKALLTMSKQHQESTCETVKLKSLLETNNHVLEEVVSLRANIEQLHHQIHEREQMLSKQSELNQHQQQTMLMSDELIHDMQNQMRSNEVQIDLLRKQNDSFKISLDNLLLSNRSSNLSRISEEIQDQSHRQPKPKPTPLWLLSNEILEQQAFTETRPVISVPGNNPRVSRWIQSVSDVNIETLSQRVDHSKLSDAVHVQPTNLVTTIESRPPTVTRSSRNVNNIRKLTSPSQTNHNKTRPASSGTNRSSSARRDVSSAKTQHLALNVNHRCSNCNTTFDDKRNYDMHKLYCRT